MKRAKQDFVWVGEVRLGTSHYRAFEVFTEYSRAVEWFGEPIHKFHRKWTGKRIAIFQRARTQKAHGSEK